ncbi:MAG: hypothetical protein ACFFCS_00175 [Candidatus Hodarchaeota archaeon]
MLPTSGRAPNRPFFSSRFIRPPYDAADKTPSFYLANLGTRGDLKMASIIVVTRQCCPLSLSSRPWCTCPQRAVL